MLIERKDREVRKAGRCVSSALLACLCAASVAAGQQAPAPSATSSTPAPQKSVIGPQGAKTLAQRPYSAAIPAPLYPSAPRKQSQFTVEYVYNYAQSNYTPTVTLPLAARGASKRDTPEGALIAFYSAMRSGDYEAWLQCWDEHSRKALEAKTKQQKNGAEYWRAIWRQIFAGKRFVLVDRLETVNYIILDTTIDDPNHPAAKQADSEVLVGHEGQWFLTNEFTDNGMVMNYDPAAPVAKVTKEYDLAPRSQLVGPSTLTGEAQNDFFAHHMTSSTITRTVQ